MLRIGTDKGLYSLGSGDAEVIVDGHTYEALGGDWAIVDHDRLEHLISDRQYTFDVRAWCVAPFGDDPLVGTANARLFIGSQPVTSFDAIPTRDEWYTPWGAPPDVRSLTTGPDGVVLVNVHVGGVWRSADALDGPWEEVVAVDDDSHQVLAHPAGVVIAAAVGFGWSVDGGRTFSWTTDGLHASYCRAVAVAGDTVLVSASTGPRTNRGAVYRRDLVSSAPFERCADGLPEWFEFNVNTFQLAASGADVALGTDDGRVYVSADAGGSWSLAAEGLPAIHCLAFAGS